MIYREEEKKSFMKTIAVLLRQVKCILCICPEVGPFGDDGSSLSLSEYRFFFRLYCGTFDSVVVAIPLASHSGEIFLILHETYAFPDVFLVNLARRMFYAAMSCEPFVYIYDIAAQLYAIGRGPDARQ